MLEEDLSIPLIKFFKNQGYIIDGEVLDIDLLAIKEDQVIAVELKLDFNYKVISQAAKRQKLFEHVYIATKTPKNLSNSAFQDKIYLLKRLGIGLILINEKDLSFKIYQNPIVSELTTFQKRNKKKQVRAIKELKNRTIRNNNGGISKQKLLTAYKEKALLVLNDLYHNKIDSPKNIRERINVNDCGSILYQNYYGWFEKVSKGIYQLSELGRSSYKEYEEIIKLLKEEKKDL